MLPGDYRTARIIDLCALVFVVGILLAVCCHEAHGQVLTLARVCKLECDPGSHPHCFNDAACIYHVGVAQAGERWAPHLLRYSRLHSRKHQRARFIRSLTATSMLRTPLEQRSWHQLLWLARRLVAGAVDNPCPGAVHWGGPMDDPSSRLVPVRTTLPTRNTFYALRARGGEA